MQLINIQIEDWQQEALKEMAAQRGVQPESLAKTLLSERILERAHCAFDEIPSPSRYPDIDNRPGDARIEQRLRRVFESW